MIGRAYRGVLHAGAVVAALLLGALAVLVTGDVIARNLGLGTLPWIIEVSEYSLPLATFLVAPWLLSRSEHVRLDTLITALPPAAGRVLERIADGVGLLICVVFVVYGTKAIASSAQQGSMVIKAIVFPEWWLYAPVPVCFALLAIEFVRRMLGRGPLAGTGPRA
ncbi:MAG: putative TRAP-type C4-dicarboxylate transport system small permease [Candidatus Rokubacteria bacterium CSP1-6]|nr:MAG: putative TRAP-type C4-dicarboxylate transport system small permease [Candidatus Rokubacteria bacterium CSP1-6]